MFYKLTATYENYNSPDIEIIFEAPNDEAAITYMESDLYFRAWASHGSIDLARILNFLQVNDKGVAVNHYMFQLITTKDI